MGWIDNTGHSAHGNSGKALRPALCLFVYQVAGGDYHPAIYSRCGRMVGA
jgi:geranylgeranyl pyrophosphate synthase